MKVERVHGGAQEAPVFGAERGALLAGLTFLEGTRTLRGSGAYGAPGSQLGGTEWGIDELLEWLDVHLIQPGRMPRVRRVQEAVVGVIPLTDDEMTPLPESSLPQATLEELPKLLRVARSRVIVTLRAFVALHTDDRFLSAAIYRDRVRRARVGNRATWVAQPHEDDLLSDVVLSLFAADILMHRVFHERALCVCDTCGRVSFQPELTTRKGCAQHMPPSGATSGFIQKWVSPTEPPPRRS